MKSTGQLTRMSTLFLRTLREDPAEAEVPSHKLLLRAGYIRRVAAGIYTWLPLGLRVMNNVARIVREEMDASGAQEVLFPALLPREIYDVSGRFEEYGPNLFRLQDRKNNDYLLGPTHEEMFTTLVKDVYSSWKDLPLSLYQIQTKYRDEARPRSGILRGREFVMKDSYSFDLDDEGLQASYDTHRDTYIRIFDRLGIDYRIVSAMSGAMGGSHSEEFLAPCAIGEDTFVSCASCGYAANVEAVTVTPPPEEDPATHGPLVEVPTPDSETIEKLAALMGVPAAATLKNVLVLVDGTPTVVLVPGDREVDLDRLSDTLAPATVELFGAEDFAKFHWFKKGYVGPQGLRDTVILADIRVVTGTAWVTGANKKGVHVRDAVVGRDFTIDRWIDVATIAEGDPCPRCSSPLVTGRAVEVGHIFQLGRKYSDAFGLDVNGPDGQLIRVTMGSYGIGVSRAVAVVAEQTLDDVGLCWPRAIAPADVHVVPVGKPLEDGRTPLAVAEEVAAGLVAAGVRVLLDDRGTAAGVAFKDAELIGVPTIVTLGKSLSDGQAEVKDRRTGERSLVPLEELAAVLSR